MVLQELVENTIETHPTRRHGEVKVRETMRKMKREFSEDKQSRENEGVLLFYFFWFCGTGLKQKEKIARNTIIGGFHFLTSRS